MCFCEWIRLLRCWVSRENSRRPWARGMDSPPEWKSESASHSVMSNSLWPHGLNSPWNSPGQNTGYSEYWVAFPFSRGFSQPRNRTQVSCIAGRVFTSWAIRESPHLNAAAAKSLQSCPTLCNPVDSRPSGSPIPGSLQARTLEWVAISFSNAWKWKVKVKSLSSVWLLATPWTAAYQAPPPMGFSRQKYWSGLPLPSPLTWIDSLNKTTGLLASFLCFNALWAR